MGVRAAGGGGMSNLCSGCREEELRRNNANLESALRMFLALSPSFSSDLSFVREIACGPDQRAARMARAVWIARMALGERV